ncbi:MAG: SDR family NAD(P)-dependent oxidoreductase, partial [Actinomycetota bacterium]|nr:SDR family NAD(P)-dependent oxidoreductase [Actinomycetota bacterium]
MKIEGHTFLVAGGGSGLGGATAHMLVESGANVLVADLRGEAPAGARFVETDVTDERSVQSVVDASLELGGLHGAVNCAGVAIAEKVLGREGPHPLESFERVVRINLIGTFNVTRLAAEAIS